MANNITEKNVLKGWFKRGLKPLEAQFHAWMDSYWHKNEEIPIKNIENLEDTLNNKAETQNLESISGDLKNHSEDTGLHKTIEEQAKLDNLADDPNSTYATKTDLQIIEDNPDYLVFPVDFRKTRKEMQAVCKEYYDSICAREISVDRPIYFKFFWYDDPANPETSLSLLVPGYNLYFETIYPYNISVKADLPIKILTAEEFENDPNAIKKCRTVSLHAFPGLLNLEESEYIHIDRYNFNLLFVPNNFALNQSQDFIKNHAGKTLAGVLEGGPEEMSAVSDRWNDLYDFLRKYQIDFSQQRYKERIPSISLCTISSGLNEIYKPAIAEIYANPFNLGGLKLRINSIEQIDGIDCFLDEILDIPMFTGLGSAYTYKLTITSCRPDVKVVKEYPTDLTPYKGGTIFIKQAL